jgi:CrcB protein
MEFAAALRPNRLGADGSYVNAVTRAQEVRHSMPVRRSVSRLIAIDRRELGAIFAGGALGAGARTGLEQLAPTHAGQWPWVTFAVNIVGCLLLGYFVTRLQERLPITAYRRPLLGTGICGGLTTFSTYQLELLRMLDHGRVGLALLYAAGSVAAGFAGVALGTSIVRRARLTW